MCVIVVREVLREVDELEVVVGKAEKEGRCAGIRRTRGTAGEMSLKL